VNPVLRYVLDEHLRGIVWRAFVQHNQHSSYPVDVVRVGDPPAPALGTLDPAILVWAEQQGRILVSLDKRSLPGHLANHLGAGRHSPGILVIRLSATVPEVLEYLVLAAYAGDPAEYQDTLRHIPS
jgi:hypothetical protein